MTNSDRPSGSRKTEGGFILALSVLLVLVLSISGMSFLHLDFLERRTTRNTLDNHSAFYLANAGVERAREVLKIPISGSTINWTSVLNSPVWNGTPLAPGVYRTDPAAVPDARLCPFGLSRGCVILPPGSPISSPDSLVFVPNIFDDGQYTVRAFNNTTEPLTCVGGPKADCDQILTVRALGLVRGDQKLLETNVLAVSTLNLINCDEGPCPQKSNGQPAVCNENTTPACIAAPGREPGALSSWPRLDFRLTDLTNNYYAKSSNFPSSPNFRTSISSNTVQSNTYYRITGNVTITNTTAANNVVVFSTGTVTVNNSANLTNAIIIGGTGVVLKGNGAISAPINSATFLPVANYPAIITAGNVTKGSGSKTVTGTIFAARPTDSGILGGTIDVNPIDVHGVLIANSVKIQGSSTLTDDHSTDPTWMKYYAFMPGFVYSPDSKTTVAVPGTWREIQ